VKKGRISTDRRSIGALRVTAALVVGAVGLWVCGCNVTDPENVSHPQLVLRVPADVLQDVAKVTVTVTGPGMQEMSATWNVQSGQHSVSGTMTVPAGDDRVFTAAAKDAGNTVLATGASAPVDLVAGDSRSVTIPLEVAGSIIGSWRIDYDATWYEIITFESGGGYEDYIYLDGDVYTFTGTYQVSGDLVTITLEGSSTTWWYSIGAGGNELTLTDHEGWSWTFYRVGG
jgi:hypothetical protein